MTITIADRQTGRTTQQIKEAPIGSVFVWINHDLSYPQSIAKKLGRDDIEVRPLSFLTRCATRGRRFQYTEVVVDHAVPFDSERYAALNMLLTSGCKVYGAKRGFLEQINEQVKYTQPLTSEQLDKLAWKY